MTANVSMTTHARGVEKLKGHVVMILFASLIAGSFSAGKIAVPHVDPAPLNAVRFLIGTVIMGIYAFGILRRPLAIPPAPWRFVLLGGLMAVYFVAMFVALSITEPVATSAVFTLTPLLTAAFGYLILRQVVRPAMAVSLAFAAIGSLWVIFDADIDAALGFEVGRGEATFFAGCIFHALFAVMLRRLSRNDSLPVSTFFILVSTTIWISLYGAGGIVATNWTALPAEFWWALAFLGIFPTAITFIFMQYASLRLPASKVMAYGYLVPVFVIVYEALLGNGWANPAIITGALVTCLGLVVLYFAPESARDGSA